MKFGYCTNVHAGTTLDSVKQNLLTYSVPIRLQLAVDQLPVGLWLSDRVSCELDGTKAVAEFGQWLTEHQLQPYTFNGFPFSDFHQPVVKHRVYEPTWAQRERLEYTLRLARIMAGLISPGQKGTISTLPIGWPLGDKNRSGDSIETRWPAGDVAVINQACDHLLELCLQLEQLELETGRQIQVCIEPEPGCLLDCWQDVVCLFVTRLQGEQKQNERLRRYLGVCHDVCHSAVMFEPQAEALNRYAEKGISVGKIQVSSAVQAEFGSPDDHNESLLAELQTFSEPRYLHQTAISHSRNRMDSFYEDLGLALADRAQDSRVSRETWRVHFHVPIFLARLQQLTTTQSQILECLDSVQRLGIDAQLEVETYAWNVLPEQSTGTEHGPDQLIEGIARELKWLQARVSAT
jgi:hypothetical protein